MKHRKLKLLAVAGLLAGLLIGPETAKATRWKYGDTRYFTAEQVCRDGAVVLAGWDKVNSGGLPPPEPGDTQTIPLGVREYANTSIPVDPSTFVPIEAYGPLLLEAMRGDQTLFKHRDELSLAWRIVDPFLQSQPLLNAIEEYPAHSWGPTGADRLLSELGHRWHNPAPNETR